MAGLLDGCSALIHMRAPSRRCSSHPAKSKSVDLSACS
jgi:hypothetical protein